MKINRARIAFVHDVIMAAVSVPLSLYLRVGGDFGYFAPSFLHVGMALFTATCAVVFWRAGMYRGVWRYASVDDMMAIAKSVSLAILIFLPLLFATTRLEDFPRSLPVINWFVLVTLLGGPRFLYRMLKDRRLDHVLERSGRARVPVLLVGAGDAAELFIREQRRDRNASYEVVGIVDEKGRRVGREIHGVPVLGTIDDVERVIDGKLARKPPHRLILTKERLDGVVVRALLEVAERRGMTLGRLPRLSEFKSGAAERLEMRPVPVEDLLQRPQAVLDRPAMADLVRGRRVLVTGAGGTIGSELARQIAALDPARLALLDSSEYLLYSIDMELAGRGGTGERRCYIGDVRDTRRVDEVVAAERPDLVFHAAAMKHVPIAEENPEETALTNIVGTRNVARACRAHGAGRMVLISTDKAVNPSSVMGATKRVAEMYCQALDLARPAEGSATRFSVVRFGNVLGSTGSVVPLFQRQIAEGGPVTVTHPEMTRYFMTVREAVELVLQASALAAKDAAAAEAAAEGAGVAGGGAAGGGAANTAGGTAGTGGRIFVLDMGEPVRIIDLARQMIRLAGLEPEKDIAIVITGPRPGEKLHEELLHDAEAKLPTAHSGIMLAAPRTADLLLIDRAVDDLEAAARGRRPGRTVDLLRRIAPEYSFAPDAKAAAAL